MIIDYKDITDEEWTKIREQNKIFLDRAIKRINERVSKILEVNNGILMSDLDNIVREELGIDLRNYDVNFMDIYIDHSEFEED